MIINDIFLLYVRDNFFQGLSTLAAKRSSLLGLLNEYKEGFSKKFIAFDPSLKGGNFEELYGISLAFLKNGKAGSSFISNYNRTLLTTPIHSALVDSFAYQCEGAKTWHLMTPEDALPTVRYHNGYTDMKDCNDREDIRKLVFTTYTPRDTMFYFPPFWAHGVVTEKGLSVLLNYRAMDIKRLFREDWKRGVMVFCSVMYFRFFFPTWDPPEISYYYHTGKIPAVTGGELRTGWFKSTPTLGGNISIDDEILNSKLD